MATDGGGTDEVQARVDRLRAAANEAARFAVARYTTFLLVYVYLGIIVGTTTDEHLLSESGLTLPSFGGELAALARYCVLRRQPEDGGRRLVVDERAIVELEGKVDDELVADVLAGMLDVRDLIPASGGEIAWVELEEGADNEEIPEDDELELVEETADE